MLGFRDSISLKLNVTIITGICILMTALGLFNYHFQRIQIIEELTNTINQVADRFTHHISHPLWNLEQDEINKIIALEMANKNINAIVLNAKIMTEAFVFGKYRDDSGQLLKITIKNLDEIRNKKAFLILYREAMKDGVALGKVTITGTDKYLNEKLYDLIVRISLLAFLTVILVSVMLVIFIRIMVTKPIEALENAAIKIQNGNLKSMVNFSSGDEIGRLMLSFNKMAQQLENNFQEIKNAHAELQKSQNTFSGFFNQGNIGMAITSLEKGWVNVNKKLCKMLGYSKEELSEITWAEMTHPDDLEPDLVFFEKMVSGEIDNYEMEKRFIRKTKDIVDTHLTVSCIRNADGSIDKVLATLQNITERKFSENRIKHLNKVLKAIRDVNHLIVWEKDPDVLIREGCKLLVDNRGYASAMIVLTDEKDRLTSRAASGPAASFKSLNTLLERNELPPCCKAQFDREVVLIADGHDVCGNCPIAEGCAMAPLLFIRLIHEDTVFGYMIVALDQDLMLDDEELSLFSEMAGDFAYALNFLRIEIAHNLSESKRKSLEGQLIQAQKMESVGLLAGGVAHDYNNISSIIIGFSEMALDKIEPSDPLHDDLMEILTAANRSTNITRQLLAFARKQTIAPKVLDLNESIENMLKMLRRLIGEDIDLAWLPGAEVWPVNIDPSQVDQILANLCINARDAIAGVGKVIIETKNISFDEDYCADHAGFVSGEFASFAVSDDGSGIAPETLGKVFEPFFTTKGLGQGTGLGLATVYGIVKQNNGFINIYSEPKKGTTLKVYLPRHTGKVVDARHKNTSENPLSQGEIVLLVEDDDSIIKLGKRMLNDLGYSVLSANTPGKAIRLAEGHSDEINLLLTDVVMPEMNGRELSDQLIRLYPNLKILFMSGYTANVIAHRGVLEAGVCFIPKPFSKKDLAIKVREALDNDIG